jgi:hypothetical protein
METQEVQLDPLFVRLRRNGGWRNGEWSHMSSAWLLTSFGYDLAKCSEKSMKWMVVEIKTLFVDCKSLRSSPARGTLLRVDDL